MSAYKTFLNNTRQFFNTNGFLRFLLAAYIFVFALGGFLYLLGAFVLSIMEPFIVISTILIYAGIILTLLREDMMTLVITSGIISLGSLIAWIIGLASYRVFFVTPFLFFILFGTLAVLVFLKAEKFKEMRAASAARAQMAGIACPRCGGFIPMNAAFCPSCGAQNPNMQQYAAPVQPQYAPPVQPQYTAPAQPQYAPPVQPQGTPQAPPAEADKPATVQCSSCGADIPAAAVFCSKCGAKQ